MATPASADDTAAQVALVVEHFHEGHRRDLPALLSLARALPPWPQAEVLAERLAAFAQALESHMFKEEMRLFPMMEQGGNTLIGHLIEDMTSEHREHEDAVAELRRLRAAMPSDTAAVAAAFDAALTRLVDDLAAHVHMEESQLFPRFLPSSG